MSVASGPVRGARERGVVLFISLIVLVAMAFATVALFRSVTSGILVAGNLGMKRAATSAADFGIEEARAWIMAGATGAPEVTAAASGYYAEFDVFGNPPAPLQNLGALMDATWTNLNSRLVTGHPFANETIRFVVHRLCQDDGAANAGTCVIAESTGAGGTKTVPNPHKAAEAVAGKVFYRVIARIEGPKKTVSFVQTTIY